MARHKPPRILDEMSGQLLSGADASTAFDQGGLLDQKKALERVLNAEMDHHLDGGEPAARSPLPVDLPRRPAGQGAPVAQTAAAASRASGRSRSPPRTHPG